MVGGMFHCSTDNWIFGCKLSIDYPNLYKFENDEANQKYLQEFEKGECQLSERRGIAIYDLYVKRQYVDGYEAKVTIIDELHGQEGAGNEQREAD
jgi:hypothetical protein